MIAVLGAADVEVDYRELEDRGESLFQSIFEAARDLEQGRTLAVRINFAPDLLDGLMDRLGCARCEASRRADDWRILFRKRSAP